MHVRKNGPCEDETFEIIKPGVAEEKMEKKWDEILFNSCFIPLKNNIEPDGLFLWAYSS